MKKKQTGKKFLLGAMIGSSVGALSMLMLKTKRGSAFKKHAMEKFHKFENYIDGIIYGSKETVGKTMKQIRKTAHKVTHKKKIEKTKIFTLIT